MPRLLLLLAIAITLVILVRRVQALPPHKRRAGYLQIVFGGAAILALILTLAGKMHWVGAALTGLLVVFRHSLPLLIRAFPFLHNWWQQRQGPGNPDNQQSQVNSALLRMTLDHSTGELAGEVLAGPWKGWFLAEMNRAQLDELMAFCQSEDEDSVQLLSSYLEQRFPGGTDHESATHEQSTASDSSGITRSEALAVLGLDEQATDEDIVAAHRSLIQKLHPDRGGNDYLAAKINEAKDFLLAK